MILSDLVGCRMSVRQTINELQPFGPYVFNNVLISNYRYDLTHSHATHARELKILYLLCS